jgi:hypothetical protein
MSRPQVAVSLRIPPVEGIHRLPDVRLRAWVPGLARSPDGAESWERHALDVAIRNAAYRVAFTLPRADGTQAAYRYGSERFWLPVPGPDGKAVRDRDLAGLLGGAAEGSWTGNPFRTLGGALPCGLAPPAGLSGTLAGGRESAEGIARLACARIRLVDGVLHAAVPEPRAVLVLTPDGPVRRLSVEFSAFPAEGPRRQAFALDRYDDLLCAASEVPGTAADAIEGLRALRPRIARPDLFTAMQPTVPDFAPTHNLGHLPAGVRDAYASLARSDGNALPSALAIAETLDAYVAAGEADDPCVLHGLHWLGTELALFLARWRTADEPVA